MAASLRAQGYTWPRIAVALRAEWPDLTARSALRVAHGWTQEEVAIRWTDRWPDNPKEPRDISGWERWPQGGRRPSLGTLERLAEIYEVDMSDLLVDVGRFSEEDACAAACAGADSPPAGADSPPGGSASSAPDGPAGSVTDGQAELRPQASSHTPDVANWALTGRAIIAYLSAMPPSLLDGLVRAAYAAQGSDGQMSLGVPRPGEVPPHGAAGAAKPYRAGQPDLIGPDGDWLGVILRGGVRPKGEDLR